MLAGVTNSAANAAVFTAIGNNTITGNSTTGTMFIFTDANYPGLATQQATIPNYTSMGTLFQGTINVKNADLTMTGLVNSTTGSALPAAMNAYTGIVWWQDRRNSNVRCKRPVWVHARCMATPYCTGDDGSVIECAVGCPTVTNPAGGNFGAMYACEPRHRYLSWGGHRPRPRKHCVERCVLPAPRSMDRICSRHHRNFALAPRIARFQVVTGAVIEDTGDTGMMLTGR